MLPFASCLLFFIAILLPMGDDCGCRAAAVKEKGLLSTITISTFFGDVKGRLNDGVGEFLGIPFAQPPVGALRWRPPSPWRQAYNGTFRATKRPKACPQTDLPKILQSEDCLTLNIYSPSPSNSSSLPVMLFIYGGGYNIGSSDQYGGTLLSKNEQVVVVTINYRLGPLGYLGLPQLKEENPPGNPTTGLYGILDQQEAMKWVKSNICYYGGDPNSITIFGESAGADSIELHLVIPSSFPYYNRAILESTSAMWNDNAWVPLDVAYKQGQLFSEALNCSSAEDSLLDCLRAASVSDVLHALPLETGLFPETGKAEWRPVLDGYILPDYPFNLILKGKFNTVPTLLGTNYNEAALWMITYPPLPDQTYTKLISDRFGEDQVDAILSMYPPTGDGESNIHLMSMLLTDADWRCPTRAFANVTVTTRPEVYVYEFDFLANCSALFQSWGAFHTSEIKMIFGKPLVPLCPRDWAGTPEGQLSTEMQGYWASFARAGTPNTQKTAQRWNTFDLSQQNVLQLGNFSSPIVEELYNYRGEYCTFWVPLLLNQTRQ